MCQNLQNIMESVKSMHVYIKKMDSVTCIFQRRVLSLPEKTLQAFTFFGNMHIAL